ncbi:MAG: ACP phosphodiesterase [Pelovirga sp.]
MNYLAHLYFSAPRPLAWAGSLMGDFVKGNDHRDLPEDLVIHLQLHRHLDTCTRTSLPFQTSRRRIDPRFRHGRSVLVDVFYDHFLACQWDRWCARPLPDFARHVYAGLLQCQHLLPPLLQRQLPRMIADDWLTSYRTAAVIERVLQRLEQRLGHKVPLAAGYHELERLRAPMQEDFSAFMVEAADLTAQWHKRAGR